MARRFRGPSYRADFAGELPSPVRDNAKAAQPVALDDDWVDRLTVCGTPRHCTARISALHAAGADGVCLIPASDREQFFAQSAEVLADLAEARR